MTAALSFLAVLALSLLFVRIATVALVHTGLAKPVARFQARSAFTGTGFTTSEAEKVVDHPVRRRIVAALMVVRSAGLIGAVSSLILSFVDVADTRDAWIRALLLLGGVAALWLLSRSEWFDRQLSQAISWALNRWTDLENYDYENLLRLSGDYRIYEVQIDEDDWLADRTLEDLSLPEEGVQVLGIHREDGRYVGAPRGSTCVEAGDRVVLYGRRKRLRDLDTRKADASGSAARREAEESHEEEMAEQDREEEGDD